MHYDTLLDMISLRLTVSGETFTSASKGLKLLDKLQIVQRRRLVDCEDQPVTSIVFERT